MGLGEHTGHGIPLILQKYNNDRNIFLIEPDSVTATFKYPEIVIKELERNRIISTGNGELSGKLNGKLNLSNIAEKILELLKNDPSLTAIKMAEITNKSKRTIDRAISELNRLQVIEREGSLKKGIWKILKK